jgi:serine/threonine-protein kinase
MELDGPRRTGFRDPMSDLNSANPISHEDPTESADPAERLRQLWQEGQRPDLDGFLAQFGPLTPEQLVDLLHVDQRERWQAGERIPAEAYLERFLAVRENVQTAMDLIYGEFRFRYDCGEDSDYDDYLRRFPQYRALLEEQFQFHRALVQPLSTSQPLRGQSTGPYPTSDRGSDGRPGVRKVVLVAGSGPSGSGEIQALLHRRLRFLALLTIAGMVPIVLFPLAQTWRGAGYLPPGVGPHVAVGLFIMGLAAGVAGVLGKWHALSLRSLRAIELLLFGVMFAFWVWVDAFVYAQLRLPEPPFWFGRLIMAKAVGLPWMFLIIVYGIFIPNTWRRCAAVVGIMAITPLVISASSSLAHNANQGHSQVDYYFDLGMWVAAAAAVATYGAHRIELLHKEVRAARRLGQYQLKQRLGSGGMGEVFLAEHVLLRRPCAIKLIRRERAGNPKNLLRFEREVQATATLTHPNTVEILDYGHTEDGTFYYVMEYLPGLSLEQLVSRHGPLPPERAVHLLRQVCGALQEAHAIGLIHRDVQPGNILVCERGGRRDVIKLLDFGLVQVAGLEQAEPRLTQEGAIAGTPAYMSPEQAAGKPELDARSDIYSLGAVAYFLLTGHPPFVRPTALQTLAAHIYESPAGLCGPGDVAADLQAVVLRCLAKDPACRFPDAESLDQALAQCGCANRWTREQAEAWWSGSAPDWCPPSAGRPRGPEP